jgi:hypothetical protein
MRRWLPGGTAALLLALLAPAAPAESAPALLAKIKKVGRKGAGNAEARKAWKALVARGPAVLPALLAAMDDEDPTSANWLGAAVDAVCERALSAGKPLPREALEKLVRDTRQSAAGRHLAYEWLARVDKSAPERLLPGMIQDKSPPLRRAAVARVLRGARAALDRGDKKSAAAEYRKALAGACDKDQVEMIAGQLGKLGVAVDVAAHLGFLRSWHLICPFDSTGGAGFARAYPPERKVDLGAAYVGKGGKKARWTEHATAAPYGVVDLNKVLGKQKGVVAYAFAMVRSPAARPVQVRVGSPNAVKIFLNGKELFARAEYHHGMEMDQYVGKGTLRAGRNEVLLKVCQNEQEEDWAQSWLFQARLCDAVGAAVPLAPEKGGKP